MAKKQEIAKVILGLIAAAGILTVAVVTPAVLPALAGILKLNKQFSKNQVKRSLQQLEKSRLISITEESDKTVVRLTKQGQEKVLKYKADDMKIKRPKHWDKKWRLVIFDVPQNFHMNRTIFTQKLKEIGMKQLQKSVWVSPFPCENEIDFLKEIYLVRSYVRVVTAESIDIQNDLIKQFNL